MTQHTDLWRRSSEFDRIRSGGDAAAAEQYCRDAMREADLSGDELQYVYFGGRLADILVAGQRVDEALSVYVALWARPATPLLEGLAYTKLLLRVRRARDAAQLVREMELRLEEERRDPQKQGHVIAEELCFLVADGLISLQSRKFDRLKRVCAEIVRVGGGLESDEFVDPELLIELIRERRYDLAGTLFGFFARHSGPGPG